VLYLYCNMHNYNDQTDDKQFKLLTRRSGFCTIKPVYLIFIRSNAKRMLQRLLLVQIMATVERFWSCIKSKRRYKYGMPSLKKDNHRVTDSFCKATILKNQFQSVFTDINSTTHSFRREYVSSHIIN